MVALAYNGSGIADVNTETFLLLKFENMKKKLILLLLSIILVKQSKGELLQEILWSASALLWMISIAIDMFSNKNEGSVNDGKSLQDE